MHVAIYGAGALGRVYGAYLALHAGARVTFIVRTSKVEVTDPIQIESVRLGRREVIPTPVRSATIPANTDVILVAVGTEDLSGMSLGDRTPIVILTPMLPKDWAAAGRKFGDRVHAALPSVVAYVRTDGVVRYWRHVVG
jgi:hypothetical protein